MHRLCLVEPTISLYRAGGTFAIYSLLCRRVGITPFVEHQVYRKSATEKQAVGQTKAFQRSDASTMERRRSQADTVEPVQAKRGPRRYRGI